MDITLKNLNKMIKNEFITVEGFREHSKASEKYVDVSIMQEGGSYWKGSIPYYYRRTGLFIETPQELAEYLNEVFPHFSKKSINEFRTVETKRSKSEYKGKDTTKPFFDKLLNMKWNSVTYDLPPNLNWARRIQEIKEWGYTLATDTNMAIKGQPGKKGTHIILLPIPKGGTTGYEVMSAKFKAKAVKILGSINFYELSSANKGGLIPDHKFPEIRWDEDTRSENLENMSDQEIKQKFQLLDNQRNQQKREVCRKCFQTNKRGKLFGINYYYKGTEDWPNNTPITGKEAEKGCYGCGWYDIEKWRKSLNKKNEN